MEKNKIKEIAILIPSYNEEKRIKKVIDDCLKSDLKILVLNDGSTDNTKEVLEEVKSYCSERLVVINHEKNKGKGEALKTGFKYIADNDYYGVITLDADGQHNTEEIKDFLNAINDSDPDIIVGSRFSDTKGMPFVRLVTNRFTSWIISNIADRRIEDVQSGYRYLKTTVLRNIKLQTKNFDTEPEILLKASWMGCSIKNIPIQTIYNLNDFKSHVNPVTDTIKFFKMVFKSLGWKKEFFRNKKEHSPR